MGSFSKNIALLTLGFWLGCVVFCVVVTQILFNSDVTSGLDRGMAGGIASAVLRRIFFLTYICGGVALFFLLVASFGSGSQVKGARRAFVLCLLLVGLNAVNDLWIRDRLNKITLGKTNAPAARVENLKKDFVFWHKISIGVYSGTAFFGALAALCLLPAGAGGKSSRKSSK